MRHSMLIVAIIIAKISFSQNIGDTVISKEKLDSLETAIYQLKDSLKRAQYKNIFFENLATTDSLIYRKDSLIINYRDKYGKIIQKNTKAFIDSSGLIAYEKVEHYNKLQLPEFVELWETARWEFNENMFIRKVYSYERFVYDSLGRKVIWLKFYPAVSRYTARRVEYNFAPNGNLTTSQSRIKIEAFWD